MALNEGYWNQKYFPHLNILKPACPSDINERLPSNVFTGNFPTFNQHVSFFGLCFIIKNKGPNDLYQQRVRPRSPHEIGIGKASGLRTLDARYVTRQAFLKTLK